jgi:hypothetical protein
MAWTWIALLLATAAPSPEAEVLGRRLAETGTLAALLPLVVGKETEELVAAHPDLDPAALRATATETARAGIDKAMTASGKAYASTLSVDDLKALVAFNETAAARRYRTAQPQVIMATMRALTGFDFKKDVMTAYCAKTGKGCATN